MNSARYLTNHDFNEDIVREIRDDLILIWSASDASEWIDHVGFLKFVKRLFAE
jgi:hypothetical protein